jgi:hypothetical protein
MKPTYDQRARGAAPSFGNCRGNAPKTLTTARPHELRRISEGLGFASRLLVIALLVELPFVIGFVVRMVRPTLEWKFPNALSNSLWLLSSVFALVGFVMVVRRLALWSEATQGLTDFVDRTKMLGTAKLAAGAQFLFMGLLMVPLFNLPIILWARAQARRARRDIDSAARSARRQDL